MATVEEKKERRLQNEIILLSQVPDIWRIANHLLDTETGDNEGPIHAFHAAFVALKNLWFSREDARGDKEWGQIRGTIALGLIKDTKKYGNTSVSMGAAKSKFDASPRTENIGFLNCGTGGIKYQLYSSTGCLHLKGEFKPKDGASPNALEVGKFKPKKPINFELTRELFAKELADAPWARELNVPVYAFVTGTVREHWENAGADEKQLMESKMKELFAPRGILPLGSSYFMSQDDEGTFELLGSQRMYANLVEAGLLNPGTMVVGSLGIGKGSCQWMIQEVDGTISLVGHKAGMTNIVRLAQLSQTLMDTYRDSVKWEKFKQTFKVAGKGVIALKSGAALLIDNKSFAAMKDELVAIPIYRERTVRVTLEADRTYNGVGHVVSYSWTGSLDRLCAEVQVLLRAPSDLEVIFREVEGKFHEVARNGEVFPHELLYFAPRGVIPAIAAEPRPDVIHEHHQLSPHVILETVRVDGIPPPPRKAATRGRERVFVPHPMETRSKRAKNVRGKQ
jgi:hypothetical protein